VIVGGWLEAPRGASAAREATAGALLLARLELEPVWAIHRLGRDGLN
jgi:hypothetical protein